MGEIFLEKRKPIPEIGFNPQQPISTGTTLIAMEFDGGVVVGTDSRTSSGSFIASRATDKITKVNDRLVVCRSGSAADTQAIADIVKYYLEVYSIMEDEPVNIWRSAQIFRNFLYKYRDQLTASVLIAGFDDEEGGQLYSVPLGGLTTRQRCTASGSGSTYVQGFLDSKWKPNLTEEECKEIVKTAVALAISRDGSSGGVIRLGVIDKNGVKKTLIRPDRQVFPTFEPVPGYPTYPKHVIQSS